MGNADQHQLQTDMNKANSQKRPRTADYRTPQKISQSPVRMMLRLLLEQPSLAASVPEVDPGMLKDTNINGIGVLCALHSYCISAPKASTAQLFEHFKEAPFWPHCVQLLQQECLVPTEDFAMVYGDSFSRLIAHYLDQRKEALISKSKGIGLSSEEKQELNRLITR